VQSSISICSWKLGRLDRWDLLARGHRPAHKQSRLFLPTSGSAIISMSATVRDSILGSKWRIWVFKTQKEDRNHVIFEMIRILSNRHYDDILEIMYWRVHMPGGGHTRGRRAAASGHTWKPLFENVYRNKSDFETCKHKKRPQTYFDQESSFPFIMYSCNLSHSIAPPLPSLQAHKVKCPQNLRCGGYTYTDNSYTDCATVQGGVDA